MQCRQQRFSVLRLLWSEKLLKMRRKTTLSSLRTLLWPTRGRRAKFFQVGIHLPRSLRGITAPQLYNQNIVVRGEQQVPRRRIGLRVLLCGHVPPSACSNRQATTRPSPSRTPKFAVARFFWRKHRSQPASLAFASKCHHARTAEIYPRRPSVPLGQSDGSLWFSRRSPTLHFLVVS